MPEFLYRRSVLLIMSVLLVLTLIGARVGYTFGAAEHAVLDAFVRAQFTSLQTATLGLLALFLGFTFTLALSRFEYRKQMVVQESNAIGNAALRSAFLPVAHDDEVDALFRRYVDLRLQSVLQTRQDSAERAQLDRDDAAIQQELWRFASDAAAADTQSVPRALFVEAINELIDSKARRDIAVANHVPESVVLFLLLFAVVAAVMLGYGNGMAGASFVTFTTAYCLLVVLIIGLILDLDRPQTGLARVSQQSMRQLQAMLAARRQRATSTP